MSTHIQGPWVIVIPLKGADEIRSCDENGELICELPYGFDDAPETALLIAAAPDLLAALRKIRSWIGSDLFDSADIYQAKCVQSIKEIDAAIAKATQP